MFETADPHDGRSIGRVLWTIAQYERESSRRLVDAIDSGELPLDCDVRAAYDELETHRILRIVKRAFQLDLPPKSVQRILERMVRTK